MEVCIGGLYGPPAPPMERRFTQGSLLPSAPKLLIYLTTVLSWRHSSVQARRSLQRRTPTRLIADSFGRNSYLTYSWPIVNLDTKNTPTLPVPLSFLFSYPHSGSFFYHDLYHFSVSSAAVLSFHPPWLFHTKLHGSSCIAPLSQLSYSFSLS